MEAYEKSIVSGDNFRFVRTVACVSLSSSFFGFNIILL